MKTVHVVAALRSPVTVIAMVCVAIGVAVYFWASMPSTASDLSGLSGDVPKPTVSATEVVASDVESVVKALQQEREMIIERRTLALDGIPFEGDHGAASTFKSYGPLDDATKTRVRVAQQQTMDAHARSLAVARENGDLAREADLLERLALDRCMERMLESDDYLVMDLDAVQALWPTSPDGWDVIRSRVLRIQGKEVMLVYCVEHKSNREVAETRDEKKSIQHFLAEDAAYRFNSQPDNVRIATIQALDKALANQPLSAEEKASLLPLAPIRRLRIHIDRQRMTVGVIR